MDNQANEVPTNSLNLAPVHPILSRTRVIVYSIILTTAKLPVVVGCINTSAKYASNISLRINFNLYYI